MREITILQIVAVTALLMVVSASARAPAKGRDLTARAPAKGRDLTARELEILSKARNDSTKEVSCPAAIDIFPCLCETFSLSVYLDCYNIASNEQFAEIFNTNFPTKEILTFTLDDSNNVTHIGNIFKGLMFLYMDINPTTLESVSNDWLVDSYSTLLNLNLRGNKLTSSGFPFDTLKFFTHLDQLYLNNNDIEYVPPIATDRLIIFDVSSNPIETINAGTLDNVTSAIQFSIGETTTLKTIQAGAFKINSPGEVKINVNRNTNFEKFEDGAFVVADGLELGPLTLIMQNNNIRTLDEAVYEPIWRSIFYLSLYSNPLECGCDMAWIVTDPVNYDVILHTVTYPGDCADGRGLTTLDPADFADC